MFRTGVWKEILVGKILDAPSVDGRAFAIAKKMGRRADVVALTAVALLWIGVWVPRLRGPIDLRWDASVYYILGTSLSEGKGYRLLNEPAEIEVIQYPPLLPLFVAAHQKALGTTNYLDVAPRLRFSYFLLSGFYLIAAYLVVRAFCGPLFAVFVCALTALSFSSYLHISDTLYAEIPFALVSMLFLLCHRRSDRAPYAAVAGILAGATYLLRSAGIALLAAWVAESLLRKRVRQAAIRAAVAAIPVIFWQVYIWRVTSSTEYRRPAYTYQRAAYAYSNISYALNSSLVDPFRPELGRTDAQGLPRRVLRNLAAIPASLGESAWLPAGSPDWILDELHRRLGWPVPSFSVSDAVLVLFGIAVLAGAGFFAMGRSGGEGRTWAIRNTLNSHRAIILLYFTLTISVISLTPWREQFWRYLAPLTPLSGLFLVHTVLEIKNRLMQRRAWWAKTLAIAVVGAPLTVVLIGESLAARIFYRAILPVTYFDAHGAAQSHHLLTYGPEWHVLDPAMEWLRNHAEPNDIIASTVPHLTYIRAARRAVLPPMETDPELSRSLLNEVPVKYLLLDNLGKPGISERYAAPVVERWPDEWKLVYSAPGGARIYEHYR
jgi:hypothetical protein